MATRRAPRVPGYRLHKPSGQAVVTLGGKDHYLGQHGSDESRAKYQRLVAEYARNGFRVPEVRVGEPYRVGELCDEFLTWAEREYRRADGQPTGSVENVRLAMRAMFELFADLPTEDFGPKSLVLYQETLAQRGLSRSTTNDRTRLVRQAFKWAVREEKVSPMVHHGLMAVRGLRRGRAGVKETEPVRPVPEAHIDAALPRMPDPVAAMVRLQLLSGARPGEMVILRPCDIDMSGKVWLYRPALHKNSWRGHERTILFGPKAQEILRAFLRPGYQERFLFSPTLAELSRRERMRAQRRTPLYPSHVRVLERKRRTSPKRHPRDRYDVNTYYRAILRACGKAKVQPWSPGRLRHNAATRLRKEFGLEAAKAVLGHRLVETTQIYAEIDHAKAVQIIEQIG